MFIFILKKQRWQLFLFSFRESRPNCTLADETLSTCCPVLYHLNFINVCFNVWVSDYIRLRQYSSAQTCVCHQFGLFQGITIHEVFNATKDFLRLGAFFAPCVCLLLLSRQAQAAASFIIINNYYCLLLLLLLLLFIFININNNKHRFLLPKIHCCALCFIYLGRGRTSTAI